MPEFLKLMESWDGYAPIADRNIDEAQVSRFLDLVSNAKRIAPWRQEYLLREVITTSDFPSLFGFTLERDMLARYQAAVPYWVGYCKQGTLLNFNAAELHKVSGNDTLLPRVVEKGEYYIAPVATGYYQRRVYKYGRQFDISWEALVNDALNAFADIPARFADAVIYTRAYNVTNLMAVAAGPNPALYGAAVVDAADLQAILNVGNLPLTVGNLETTLELMALQTDVNGRPLGIQGRHLVVPPGLEMTARAIMQSPYVQQIAGAVALPTMNIIPTMGIQLHINRLLPTIDASGNRNGTWYLFADLGQGAAIQIDFLRGYESPEICMKASDKVAVGGGAPLNPFSGDFATDNIFYRVRDCHGGVVLDPRMTYAQVNT